MNIRVLRGRNLLAELGSPLDDLHRDTGVPIVCRRQWLQSWTAHFLEYQPLAVAVEGSNAQLSAVALLALRQRRGITEVVRMGHGAADYARLPARDIASTAHLARAVAAELRAIRGPWALYISQLPVDDPVARGIAGYLPEASMIAADVSLTLRFGPERSFRAHISYNHYKNTRLAINRMRKAKLRMTTECVRDPAEIARILPQVTELRRQRDTMAGRPNHLADPSYAAFREAIIMGLAERGEIEITTMRLEEEIVAYKVALLDGQVYRLWDGRFSPAWSRFYPGHLTMNAILERTLKDPRFTELDLMRGNLEYKARLANEIVPAQTVVAWSSPVTQTLFGWADRLKRLRGPWRFARSCYPGVGR